MGHGACGPLRYTEFRPEYEALCRLYALARQRGIFVRSYDEGFAGMFDSQPWPLPECRVSEWACLLDLEKIRPFCTPWGPALTPGAFRRCGTENLDTGVAWFRDMHALGLRARHFELTRYLKHWVGTGNKTPRRYALAELNALELLQRQYPQYLQWLTEQSGEIFLSQAEAE